MMDASRHDQLFNFLTARALVHGVLDIARGGEGWGKASVAEVGAILTHRARLQSEDATDTKAEKMDDDECKAYQRQWHLWLVPSCAGTVGRSGSGGALIAGQTGTLAVGSGTASVKYVEKIQEVLTCSLLHVFYAAVLVQAAFWNVTMLNRENTERNRWTLAVY